MSVTLPEAVRRSATLVDPALEAALDRLHPQLRLVAAYHRGWVDEKGQPIPRGRGGKALRPALALLGAEAAGGSAEKALPAALAVELVHDFSLLHDDVMDGDLTRRHRPTAWTVFGIGAAVLAGDGLLALANELLAEAEPAQDRTARLLLAEAVRRLVDGQADDLAFETRLDVTEAQYMSMAAGKTAALLSCSCSLGAALVGAPDRLVRGLADAGEHLGMAFQLVDDLLGIWGNSGTTGKPVLADLAARKKSAPIVAALARAGQDGAPDLEPLRAYLASTEPADEATLEKLGALVEEAGGRSAVEAEAERQLAAAEASLAALDIAPDLEAQLLAIARFVTARDR